VCVYVVSVFARVSVCILIARVCVSVHTASDGSNGSEGVFGPLGAENVRSEHDGQVGGGHHVVL